MCYAQSSPGGLGVPEARGSRVAGILTPWACENPEGLGSDEKEKTAPQLQT